MEVIHKKLFALFIITLVVSLTPAFAFKMEEVGKEAQLYANETNEKMNFFSKIKFLAKGFKLLNKVTKARKEADRISKEGDDGKSSQEQFNSMTNQTNNLIKTKKNLINFRNNKINNINTTNMASTEEFLIPAECQNSADQIMRLLDFHDIKISNINQNEITIELKGHIVQLLDEKGFIRYVYVKNIVLDGETPQVIIYTGENTEKTMSLDEFKKSYSGIVFTIYSGNTAETVVDIIVSLQREELENQKNTIMSQKDKSNNKITINLILIAVGVALAITGAFIATYFGKQVALRFNEIRQIRNFDLISETEALGSYRVRSDPIGGANEINRINSERAAINKQWEIPQLDMLSSEEDYAYYIGKQMAYFLREKMIPEFEAYVAQRTAEGCLIVGSSTLEILGYIAMENWIKVVACGIGLFIFLAGAILTCYAGYMAIKYLLQWLEYKGMLESKEQTISVWNAWLTIKQDTNTTYIPSMNATTL